MKNFLKIFSSSGYLSICKNKCDPVIPSGDTCDERILQSNHMKTFPAIAQEQEFPRFAK